MHSKSMRVRCCTGHGIAAHTLRLYLCPQLLQLLALLCIPQTKAKAYMTCPERRRVRAAACVLRTHHTGMESRPWHFCSYSCARLPSFSFSFLSSRNFCIAQDAMPRIPPPKRGTKHSLQPLQDAYPHHRFPLSMFMLTDCRAASEDGHPPSPHVLHHLWNENDSQRHPCANKRKQVEVTQSRCISGGAWISTSLSSSSPPPQPPSSS